MLSLVKLSQYDEAIPEDFDLLAINPQQSALIGTLPENINNDDNVQQNMVSISLENILNAHERDPCPKPVSNTRYINFISTSIQLIDCLNV